MKNKISLIIIFSLSCFILIGCATNVSTVKDKGHTVSLSEIELFLADSVFFKSSIVVPLETNSSSLVQKITRMCIVQDTLFILDSALSKVFIFDMKGHYLGGIHEIGNGPQEYIHISDICNYIAQVWQSSEFKRHIDNRKERDGNLEGLDRQYLQIYESMEDEDNPILLIYELPCNDAD